MNNRHSTQFEPERPLTEEQVEQEVRWMTCSMALRPSERHTLKSDRPARRERAPWIELWANKLDG